MNKKLITSLLICHMVGIIAGIFTSQGVTGWYAFLEKPILSPPNYIFAPIWTTLYTLMGISLYLVWKQKPFKKTKEARIIFFIQLALNFLWSFIFFVFHSPLFAFVDIIALWCTIIATMYFFYKHSNIAAYLLIPYLLWVSFASYLNFMIYYLN